MGAVNLCRLCAVNKDNFVGIYEEEGHKLSLETKITKCLQIEVCKFRNLMFICHIYIQN
jgi:hypothetical protein